jgi:hypothetical protein
VKIAYRVQNVAGRDAALKRLLPLLPRTVEIMVDMEVGRPSPWRGYHRCLQNPPKNATHLCIIQDDALPCEGFTTKLEEAVTEKPDDVLSLFVGGLPGQTRRNFWQAMKAGSRWTPVYFREIHHVVALCWPIPLVHEILAWYETAKVPGPKPPLSDDAVVGYWARTQRKLFQATVPCLVQHPDDFPSVVQGSNRFGDMGRRAIAFIDDAEHPVPMARLRKRRA